MPLNSFPSQEKHHYSPIAVGGDGEDLRRIIARAFKAARSFDGSDAGIDALIEAIDPFDQFASRRGEDSTLSRDDVESGLSRHARGRGHEPVTVTDLLDLAQRSFGRLLTENKVALNIFHADLVFLPTHGQDPIQTVSGCRHSASFTDHLSKGLILRLV
ncbi:MAG: hypothetical protein IPI58_08890 [Alphaproteobacteria bacterium]|nr:MAG: hypothetical protein IPI58_08890 [Alphaproteobacteria bacterium]